MRAISTVVIVALLTIVAIAFVLIFAFGVLPMIQVGGSVEANAILKSVRYVNTASGRVMVITVDINIRNNMGKPIYIKKIDAAFTKADGSYLEDTILDLSSSMTNGNLIATLPAKVTGTEVTAYYTQGLDNVVEKEKTITVTIYGAPNTIYRDVTFKIVYSDASGADHEVSTTTITLS